jgi:uncharacterized membrane protein
MKFLKKNKKDILFLILLLIITLPAVFSLFHPGFFPSDDGEWMVIRLTDFHRSFVSGQIPVRWADRLNYGYGYPVFNFLYPLSLYIGEFFHLLGFNFVNSIKLVFIFSFFLSGIFMYFFVSKLWGSLAGLVSAVLYIYSPYRFLDVYVRGSIGECLAFVFPPLIFLSLFRLKQKKLSFRYLALGAIALAGLIMSHNIMAMLFLPLTLAYTFLLIFQGRYKFFMIYTLFFFLGLGLSCFFWLPALYDKKFIILDQVAVANYWEHFPSLSQLLFPSWGYGPSVGGSTDQVSYQVGVVHLLVVIFSAYLLIKFWRANYSTNLQILFFLLVFIGAFFLMLSVSLPIWKISPFLWRTQFPWRLLAMTTFASAFLGGGAVRMIKNKNKIILSCLIIALAIGLNWRYAKPQFFVNRPESFYTTNEATTTVKDEYMPVWVKEKPTSRPAQKVEIISGRGKIENLNYNSRKISFTVFAEEEVKVQINTIYFPGWYLKVDNQPFTKFEINDPKGVINFVVSSGNHQVFTYFGETEIRALADLISLGSLIITGGLLVKGWRRKNED